MQVIKARQAILLLTTSSRRITNGKLKLMPKLTRIKPLNSTTNMRQDISSNGEGKIRASIHLHSGSQVRINSSQSTTRTSTAITQARVIKAIRNPTTLAEEVTRKEEEATHKEEEATHKEVEATHKEAEATRKEAVATRNRISPTQMCPVKTTMVLCKIKLHLINSISSTNKRTNNLQATKASRLNLITAIPITKTLTCNSTSSSNCHHSNTLKINNSNSSQNELTEVSTSIQSKTSIRSKTSTQSKTSK